jgi:hypothetical protein
MRDKEDGFDEFGSLLGPEETFDEIEFDLGTLEERIADLQEREKESTGVDPAICQRIRAEMLAKNLYREYGIKIGTLDLMTVLMYTGIKLSVDSLGHVQAGYDSLTYESTGKDVVDLEKYKISRRIEK